MAPLGVAAAPIAVPVLACAVLVPLPAYAAAGGSLRKAQEVNDALLDSGVSYSAFLATLREPKTQTPKGSYSIKTYLATQGFTSRDYPYQVGFKNGRVIWVAYNNYIIDAKIHEYRQAHGKP